MPLFAEHPAVLLAARARPLELDADAARRFARKLAPFPDADGHVWWLGAVSGGPGGGHGKFQLRRGDPHQTSLAHRVAWHLQHGPLDPALVLRHRCDVRLCTAPDHLIPGTAGDNVLDMLERGRHRDGHRRDYRDPRPPAQLSRDVRAAVRRVLRAAGADPDTVAEAARAALAPALPPGLEPLPFPLHGPAQGGSAVRDAS